MSSHARYNEMFSSRGWGMFPSRGLGIWWVAAGAQQGVQQEVRPPGRGPSALVLVLHQELECLDKLGDRFWHSTPRLLFLWYAWSRPELSCRAMQSNGCEWYTLLHNLLQQLLYM